jgi:hypothetical protein
MSNCFYFAHYIILNIIFLKIRKKILFSQKNFFDTSKNFFEYKKNFSKNMQDRKKNILLQIVENYIKI